MDFEFTATYSGDLDAVTDVYAAARALNLAVSLYAGEASGSKEAQVRVTATGKGGRLPLPTALERMRDIHQRAAEKGLA